MLNRKVIATFAISAVLLTACGTSVGQTDQGPPYSPVIESNGVIYLAGHLGRVPGTATYPEGGSGPQTTQALENIRATLATVNAGMEDVVRCQVFMTDIGDFSQMNEAYRPFFPETPPARTTVEASALAGGAMVEIECTAVRGHGGRP